MFPFTIAIIALRTQVRLLLKRQEASNYDESGKTADHQRVYRGGASGLRTDDIARISGQRADVPTCRRADVPTCNGVDATIMAATHAETKVSATVVSSTASDSAERG